MSAKLDALAVQADAVYQKTCAALTGLDPGVQGAVLAQLLALYLAGHHESVREHILKLHVEMVRELVELVRQEARAKGIPL